MSYNEFLQTRAMIFRSRAEVAETDEASLAATSEANVAQAMAAEEQQERAANALALPEYT